MECHSLASPCSGDMSSFIFTIESDEEVEREKEEDEDENLEKRGRKTNRRRRQRDRKSRSKPKRNNNKLSEDIKNKRRISALTSKMIHILASVHLSSYLEHNRAMGPLMMMLMMMMMMMMPM